MEINRIVLGLWLLSLVGMGLLAWFLGTQVHRVRQPFRLPLIRVFTKMGRQRG